MSRDDVKRGVSHDVMAGLYVGEDARGKGFSESVSQSVSDTSELWPLVSWLVRKATRTMKSTTTTRWQEGTTSEQHRNPPPRTHSLTNHHYTPPTMPASAYPRAKGRSLTFITFIVALALALFTSSTSALTESAAAAFDSYIPRLGVPHTSNAPSLSLSPRYHRLLPHGSGSVQGGKAQTAIFSTTQSGIVGAVNPRNGNIVWRQRLQDQIQGFWLDGETAVVLEGQGGEKVHLFHALSGWNLWTRQLTPAPC